jgi:hypothetical protein
VVNSWKDPTVPVRQYQKILAVFISSDATARRSGEDEMVRRIPRAVASYTVLPDAALKDAATARAWVRQNGYDLAVLMRPVAIDKETSYVPGTSSAYAVPVGYRSAWGYWGTGWGAPYDPGHYKQDKVVYVETNVYSLDDEKLIWSSKTKSYNPESVPKLVDEIVAQSIAEMKKQNVIAGGV